MAPRSLGTSPADAPHPLPLWAAACFLVSGAAGLIYEVAWSKEFSYLLGNSLHAISTVVAAFLTGLALGAYVLGTRVARLRRGARAYALLELGIGLIGLVSMPLLRGLDPLVGVLYRSLGGESGLFMAARFLVLFVLLLPPTALMGATLPVLVGHFEYRGVGPALARLYAINTAGAVVGSALAGFVLMPGIGLTASTWVAAGLNATAALVAWLAAGRVPVQTEAPAPGAAAPAATAPAAPPGARAAVPPRSAPAPAPVAAPEPLPPLLLPGARLTLALLFALSGFGALAFQIAWVRLFGLLLGSSVYSFAAVLAVYLSGLALGSAVVAPWLRAVEGRGGAARLLALLGSLQLGLAVVTLATVFLFPRLPEALFALGRAAAGDWPRLYLGELGLIAAVLLVPCVGFGAVFPVATRLLQSRDGGHATGLGYAVNTVGTLAGSLLAGFVLIPALGVQGTHVGAALLMGAVGALALALAVTSGLAALRPALGGAFAALLALVLLVIVPRWDPALMSIGVYRPIEVHRIDRTTPGAKNPVRRYTRVERTLFYREGVNGSVYVASDSSGRYRYLKVGGKTDASTGDMLTQVLLGVLPGVVGPQAPAGAPAPRGRAAVIGLGSGITLSAVLATGVASVEVMEIEPAVVEASRFFDEPGRAPLADPRVRLIVGDARTRFFNARETYDVVVSEPSNPWIAGVNNLFTVDFYRRLRARLSPQGVFCQWIQLYELSPGTLGSMLASFLEVFPTGHAFYLRNVEDLLLVAAPPGATLPLERAREPEVVHQLTRARQLGPESLAAWYACPFDSLRVLTRGARLNHDDLPVVEYRAPRDLFRVGWMGGRGMIGERVPVAGWGTARALFADWPPETWYLGRARQLARAGFHEVALASARDAAAEGMPGIARELESMIAADQRNRELTRAHQEAREAALAGRSAEARDILLQAVRLAPEDGLTWVLLAETQRRLGDQRAALDAAARGIALGDSLARAEGYVVEGLVAMARGRSREGAAAFAQAVRWGPRSERNWLFVAQALRSAGDDAGAAAACRRGIAAAEQSESLRALLEDLERR